MDSPEKGEEMLVETMVLPVSEKIPSQLTTSNWSRSSLLSLFDFKNPSTPPSTTPVASTVPPPIMKDANWIAHAMQRKNLLQMLQLAVKRLIETGVEQRHQLTELHEPLQQFCVMLEYTMRHGLIVKKSLFGSSKPGTAFWDYICTGLSHIEHARQSLETLRNIPSLQSDVARCRAWIRLSLMEKNLADYFNILVENKKNSMEYYESWGLLCCEEAPVVAGLLVGLGAIDANIDLKSSDMEDAGVIDITQYLKDGNYRRDNVVPRILDPSGLSESESKLEEANRIGDEILILVDQKNYMEALAAKLRSELDVSHAKVTTLQVEKNELLHEMGKYQALQIEHNRMKELHTARVAELEKTLAEERLSFKESMNGMESMYQAMLKQFETEMVLRVDLEQSQEILQARMAEKEMEIDRLKQATQSSGFIEIVNENPNLPLVSVDKSPVQDKISLDEAPSRSGTPEPMQPITPLSQKTNDIDYSSIEQSNQSSPSISGPQKDSPRYNSKRNDQCSDCHQAFSVNNRKQHCRACKRIVCTDCAQ
eukprot:Ihof_evm7s2 gene=Ihof_evmTU7s2